MTAVVVTHAVGNIDTWLKGGANRKERGCLVVSPV